MKVGVVGQCTAPGIAMALKQMIPDAEVFGFEAIAVVREGRTDETVRKLAECDVVFAARTLPDSFAPLDYASQSKLHERAFAIPASTFTGFHPDCIYLTHGGKQYRSSLGLYNSAIAAACFSLRLNVEETLRAYNSDIYRRLGYFDEFAKAKSFTAGEFSRCGLDINDVWDDWMNFAPFMHTINHPTGDAISCLARALAVKAGLLKEVLPQIPRLAYDSLSMSTIFPVYPEIAASLGQKTGSLIFKRPGPIDLSGGGSILSTLREMIADSFAIYQTHPPEVFTCPAVERAKEVVLVVRN